MEQQKAEDSVAMRCRVRDVSSSGYDAWRHHPPSQRAQQDRELTDRIRAIHAASRAPTMGSVGDALDNAVAESFFATLQTELLNQGSWPTRQALKTAIFEYIEVFYNRRRRHSALGYLSPEAFERRWRLHHEVSAPAA